MSLRYSTGSGPPPEYMVSLTDLRIFLVKHFISLGEKNSGPRIAPDRVSSGPTSFTGSVAMDFVPGHAPIDPIEAKCEHLDVLPEIFLRLAKPSSVHPRKFPVEKYFEKMKFSIFEKNQNFYFSYFF